VQPAATPLSVLLRVLGLTVMLLGVCHANGQAGELAVATREVPPFAMQDESGQWHGITIDLWERIAEENEWTSRYEERSIDGMVARARRAGCRRRRPHNNKRS